jgi:DNA-binding transcriptional MerR regulator
VKIAAFDPEWVELIAYARQLGFTVEQVQQYLRENITAQLADRAADCNMGMLVG